MTETADLYRHFSKGDELLYVGVSMNAFARYAVHVRSSPWVPMVAKMTIEKFDSIDDALVAERSAIISEKPMFNKVYADIEEKRRKPPAKMRTRYPENLTEEFVASAPDGKHGDGDGLFLRKSKGSAQWIYRYQFMKKRRNMGLGGWPKVSLGQARQRKRQWEAVLNQGLDPITERKKQKAEYAKIVSENANFR